jgi:hypothetical protein
MRSVGGMDKAATHSRSKVSGVAVRVLSWERALRGGGTSDRIGGTVRADAYRIKDKILTDPMLLRVVDCFDSWADIGEHICDAAKARPDLRH